MPAALKLTPEVCEQVIAAIAAGSSITAAARVVGVNHSTLVRRLNGDKELQARIIAAERAGARRALREEQAAARKHRLAKGITADMRPEHASPIGAPRDIPATIRRGGPGTVITAPKPGVDHPGAARTRTTGGTRIHTRLGRGSASPEQRDWLDRNDQRRADPPFEMRFRDSQGREIGHCYVGRAEAAELAERGWELIP